jgi:uncharacterized membrane protein YiaA
MIYLRFIIAITIPIWVELFLYYHTGSWEYDVRLLLEGYYIFAILICFSSHIQSVNQLAKDITLKSINLKHHECFYIQSTCNEVVELCIASLSTVKPFNVTEHNKTTNKIIVKLPHGTNKGMGKFFIASRISLNATRLHINGRIEFLIEQVDDKTKLVIITKPWSSFLFVDFGNSLENMMLITAYLKKHASVSETNKIQLINKKKGQCTCD